MYNRHSECLGIALCIFSFCVPLIKGDRQEEYKKILWSWQFILIEIIVLILDIIGIIVFNYNISAI